MRTRPRLVFAPRSLPHGLGVSLGLALAACGPKAPTRVIAAPSAEVAAPGPRARPANQAIPPEPAQWRRFAANGPSGAPSVRWSVRLDAPVTIELVTDGDVIFAVCAGRVHAFSAAGVELWRSAVSATGAPSIDGDRLLVPGPNGALIGLARDTGLIVQELAAGGALVGRTFPIDGGQSWATDAGDVRGLSGWRVQASDSVSQAPASDGFTYVFPTAAAELISGQADRVRWRAVLPGPASTPPILTEASVFTSYAPKDGRSAGVMALSPDTGLERWRTPLDGSPVRGMAFGELLLVPLDSGLVGVAPEDGDLRWTAPVDGALSTGVVLAGFGAYVGNADGRLHRFDPDDGGESWSLQLGASITAGPVVVGELVIVGLADGTIAAVGGAAR